MCASSNLCTKIAEVGGKRLDSDKGTNLMARSRDCTGEMIQRYHEQEYREQAMERNIQDNPKVIWGWRRQPCHEQLQGIQEETWKGFR